MFSRNHLFRASALFALGLFTLGQTNLAEETIAPAVSDVDNDLDSADTDEEDASQTSHRVHATPSWRETKREVPRRLCGSG